MTNKKAIILTISILLVVCFLGIGLIWPYKGEVFEQYESNNKYFKIKAIAYEEEGIIKLPMGGAYYEYQSAPINSENWQEIITIRHDDPNPISKDKIYFVNDQIGYFYMNYDYCITIDGGKNWIIGNATKDLPNWENYRESINTLKISPDGSGEMIFINKAPTLYTKDYGKHWNLNK